MSEVIDAVESVVLSQTVPKSQERLAEQGPRDRSRRQTIAGLNQEELIQMERQHLLGSAIGLGVLVVFLLIIVAVTRHPASVQGDGIWLLWLDIGLLVAYATTAFWLWRQSSPGAILSASVGVKIGILLGCVHVANHLLEFLVVNRPFVLIITPVFLMLALFGAAGSVGWERTRSLVLALIAGTSCAVVGILIALIAAFLLNLTFEKSAALQLKGAFALSGMNDSRDFLVRNMLQATSEGLMRMPLLAILLSFVGTVINVSVSMVSRRIVFAVTFIIPIMFTAGAVVLWYADSIDRSARPPFIMTGVALAGVALSSAHAIWSALRRTRHRTANLMTEAA